MAFSQVKKSSKNNKLFLVTGLGERDTKAVSLRRVFMNNFLLSGITLFQYFGI